MYGLKLCCVFFCWCVVLLVFFSSLVFTDGPLARKLIASGKKAKWLGFMTYCLVYHLQGSISLLCVIAVSRGKEHEKKIYIYINRYIHLSEVITRLPPARHQCPLYCAQMLVKVNVSRREVN